MTTAWEYRKRPIAMLERWKMDQGRTCKVYGISTTGPLPRPELTTAAKALAADLVPYAVADDPTQQTAVLISHDAGDTCWVLVQTWVQSCILRSFVYGSDGATPTDLKLAAPGITACIWELEVMDFERRAFIDNMLLSSRPDLEAYLAAEMNGEM